MYTFRTSEEIMKVFEKVLSTIKGHHPNGHAIANQKNRLSLVVAKKEIKKMIKGEK